MRNFQPAPFRPRHRIVKLWKSLFLLLSKKKSLILIWQFFNFFVATRWRNLAMFWNNSQSNIYRFTTMEQFITSTVGQSWQSKSIRAMCSTSALSSFFASISCCWAPSRLHSIKSIWINLKNTAFPSQWLRGLFHDLMSARVARVKRRSIGCGDTGPKKDFFVFFDLLISRAVV